MVSLLKSSVKYIVFIAMLVSISWLIPITSHAVEIAVSPMLIEINAKPNEKKSFEFNVKAKGKGHIFINLFDITQSITGHMQFIEADLSKSKRPPSWVSLYKKGYAIKDGQNIKITGTIKIPRGVSGTHFIAVTVESKNKKLSNKGVKITVRYAVVIKVTVKGKKFRAITKIDQIGIKKQAEKLLLVGYISNLSKSALQVSATALLRNSTGGLIERVELKSLSAWQRHDHESNIIPGATIRLEGIITKALIPGEYKLTLVPRINGKNRKVLRQTITVSEEHRVKANFNQQESAPFTAARKKPARTQVLLVNLSK